MLLHLQRCVKPRHIHTGVYYVVEAVGITTIYRRLVAQHELDCDGPPPLQCVTLVHREHPSANAAEYSNAGGEDCFAVFDA